MGTNYTSDVMADMAHFPGIHFDDFYLFQFALLYCVRVLCSLIMFFKGPVTPIMLQQNTAVTYSIKPMYYPASNKLWDKRRHFSTSFGD